MFDWLHKMYPFNCNCFTPYAILLKVMYATNFNKIKLLKVR